MKPTETLFQLQMLLQLQLSHASGDLGRLFSDGLGMAEDTTALTEHLTKLAAAGVGMEEVVEVAMQLRAAWREFHDRAAIMSSVVVRQTDALSRKKKLLVERRSCS